MSMRKNQIDSLLIHAKKSLVSIRDEYVKALEDKAISPSLQIDVKNFLENLRSGLDYTAHDIYEKVIEPVRTKNGDKQIRNIYFPYGNAQNDFYSNIQSNLPDLKNLSPQLFNIIEARQTHLSGDSWLYDFCKILNQKKHESLSPQVIEIENHLDIFFPSGGIISLGGGTISGSGTISSGQGTIILNNEEISGNSPAKNFTPGVKQIVNKWEYFKFTDTNIVVLPFLEKVLENTEKTIEDIYSHLDNF